MWEFGDELEFSWIMGGLARSYGADYRDQQGSIGSGPDCFADLMSLWLEVSAESGMPTDPRLWTQSPLASTYPACQAVKAAAEQGAEAGYRYLRRIREGVMCERRKLDHVEALIAEAGPAGLDTSRFEIDIRSNAIIEAFAKDLEEVRAVPDEAREMGTISETEGRERVSFPSVIFVAADGAKHAVWGSQPYDRYREAAHAAGAQPANEGSLEPIAAIERFGRCATRELEELTQKPAPVLGAELWAAAREWKLRPVNVLTGTLWEAA
jgi:predicted DsbA family dithiol-disulfide isomerase